MADRPPPPGPRHGAFFDTLAYLSDPVSFLEQRQRACGPVFRVTTLMYGEQVFLADPAALRDAFASDPDDLRAGEANTALRHVVGEQSVSCLDGAAHQARRRLLSPVLQAARADAGLIGQITRDELASLPPGRPVALRPALRRVTLALMLRAAFGELSPGVAALGGDFARMVDLGALPFAQLGVIPALRLDLGPLSPWRAFSGRLGSVNRGIFHEITRRRGCPGAGAPSMLNALLAAREGGQPLPDATLRDELFTLLGAGYETTATALSWALESILQNPGLTRQLRDEAASAGPDDELPLLDAAIRQSLGQRPVLPTVTRRVRREVTLGGQRLPEGTSAVLCLYLAQRASPPLWAPFGGGTRRCPGMALALRQMRQILAAALSGFDLELARRAPSRPVFRGTTLAPAGGVVAIVRRRGAP